MTVHQTTDSSFEADVLQSDIPVLVDFWAEWCGPCRMIAPVLDEIATLLAGEIKIVKMNIDSNPDTPARYGVRSIPTLLLIKGGEELASRSGVAPSNILMNWIASSLKSE